MPSAGGFFDLRLELGVLAEASELSSVSFENVFRNRLNGPCPAFLLRADFRLEALVVGAGGSFEGPAESLESL